MPTKRSSRRAPASLPLSAARKVAAALITLALLPIVYLASAEAAVMELRASSSSDRRAATALSGAAVAGNVYVFVPRDGVSRVEFWIDDPSMVGSRYSLDRSAEFDLAGTLRSGLARPLDTTRLADGSHTVTARVRGAQGTTSILRSTFTVANQPTATTSTTTTTAPTTAPPPSYTDRVSAGSSADVIDSTGAVWSADRGFAGGSVMASAVAIAGTDDDVLYAKHRWGLSGYTLAVPCAATYRVDLHLAEIASLTAGQRVFDVTAEGTTMVSRLDVAATVGWGTALVRSFDVAVGDGALNVGFVAVVEDPMISAVAVHQATACGDAATTTTTTTTTTAPSSATTTTTAPKSTTTTTTAPSSATTTTTAPSSTTTTTTTAPPAPTTGGACPAYPAFPDGNCTGWRHTGVTLSAYSGPTYITTSGTVIDGKLINGDLTIRASNVTIRRSQVNGTINLGYSEASNVLIEDVEVNAGNTTYAAIGSSNFTCRRCNIYGGGQGINGYNFTVEDSWIHDLYGSGTVHSEAILGYGGNMVVRHNRLSGNYNSASGGFAATDGGMSSSVSFYTHGDWGPINNVVFEKNRLNVGGGDRDYAGFCLYGGGALTSNSTFRDNVFARHPLNSSRCGYHGTVTDIPSGAGSSWTNNRYEDGTPV